MTIDKLATQGRRVYSTLAGRQYSEIAMLRNETLRSMFASKENYKHKKQIIANIKGVRYIDDSKSITTNSTWFTFETIGTSVIWILEIKDNTVDFSSLANSVKEKVKDDIYQIKNGEFLTKIDKYFDCFYQETDTLLTYLQDNCIIFIDEIEKIK